MVDSVTAIEIAREGINIGLVAGTIVIAVWVLCKIKDLIFGDE